MFRIHRFVKCLFVVALGLIPASSASAGPILDWLGIGDNPPQSYSPARYWAPPSHALTTIFTAHESPFMRPIAIRR